MNKAPLEMQKLQGDIAQQPLDLQKKAGDITVQEQQFERTAQEIEANRPEAKIEQIRKETEVRETTQGTAKKNLARESFSKDFEAYTQLDEFVRRGTSLPTNLQAGVRSFVKSKGGSIEGAALATRKGVVNRMVPQLARLSSEVGNLNIFEQIAQRELIPNEFDSQKTADLKNAFLGEIGSSIEKQDGNKLRETMNRFIESEAFDKSKRNVYSSIAEADNAKLKKGTQIIVKDNNGRYRRAVVE